MSAGTLIRCDECSEIVKITLDRYGSGVMGVISCPNCGESYDTDAEADSISWGELAELTHATALERFGFCLCEDPGDSEELPYSDCPKYAGNGELVSVNESGLFIDSLGRFGYRTHFTGAYICYTCGALCDPDRHGWENEE